MGALSQQPERAILVSFRFISSPRFASPRLTVPRLASRRLVPTRPDPTPLRFASSRLVSSGLVWFPLVPRLSDPVVGSNRVCELPACQPENDFQCGDSDSSSSTSGGGHLLFLLGAYPRCPCPPAPDAAKRAALSRRFAFVPVPVAKQFSCLDFDRENEDVGYRSVEIASAFTHLPQKEMARDTPGSPMSRPRDLVGGVGGATATLTPNVYHTASGDPTTATLHGHALQQKILELQQQHQLQQQILRQQYQAQERQLIELHEQQMHQLKVWEQQKQLEEQRREKERLEALRKKDKHDHSAIASTEVKQRLQSFLVNKKQREAAAAANGAIPGTPGYRSWLQPQSESAGTANASHPYRMPQMLQEKFADDFPLRKTASEPNLLKVRLKQRVERNMAASRNSPLTARRKDRLLSHLKRKSLLANSSSNPESGPNSPPTVGNSQASPTAGGNSAAIQEESENTPYGGPLTSGSQQGSLSDLSLFSSPSMPNISLGRPHVPSGGNTTGTKLATVSEAEVRAAFTARLGMPLTGQMLPGTLPFYPSLTVIEGESANSGYVHKQMQNLEHPTVTNRQHPSAAVYHGGAAASPITDTQVAHARLQKAGHRPLGRTQSAPLPLGHPMLQGGMMAPQTHYEEYLAEKQLHDQQQAHNYLKQQIRQTVLTRVGSRGQANQLDEAPESEESEVIDLTGGKKDLQEESEISKQQRDREQFLQQQRDLMMRHTLQISNESTAYSGNSSGSGGGGGGGGGSGTGKSSQSCARPLSRALSSPLVHLGPQSGGADLFTRSSSHRPTTGLAYDPLMLKHACVCGETVRGHPEHGGRLQSVWARLSETGLLQRCDRIRSRKATLEEIQTCHSEAHALLFGTNPMNRQKLDVSKLSQLPIKNFVRLPCGGVGVDSDTTWNELNTAPAARMAVGCVVDLAFKTVMGDIKNGFAVVRPPGHHAETNQAMGFCFFNSVAIAARLLQQKLDVRKIMILDWDVHHGNGTQQMFYDDPRVLYLSIHRHDEGNFFPGTGGSTECGAGEGLGCNVNVAWSGGLNPPMGDAEYLAAFRTVVMPIAKAFDPSIVLVSAGFDAAVGHAAPLGGYKVSPACFGKMTQQLLGLADGKVVLALEGGYDLAAICDSAQECVRALLGDEPSQLREEELTRIPCQNAIDTLQKTIAVQMLHWPCVKVNAHTVTMSAIEAGQKERDETETVSAMASLSMQQPTNLTTTPEHSREVSEEPMEQDDGK
ncbi:histone deacetylase 4 isoform X16 [Lasioglossum baleicum]|uniref:histone deacetylase 4 isoform X16 n=1 Tax=Lasioglossum baleicum TaxID=434251 RepID=UPI003FCEE501